MTKQSNSKSFTDRDSHRSPCGGVPRDPKYLADFKEARAV